MSLICPACGSENRSVAKYCIECIAALPSDFEPTQVEARLGEEEEPPSEDMPPALMAFAAASAAPPVMPAPRSGADAERGRARWVSMAAIAIALVVGAAAWLMAGAGPPSPPAPGAVLVTREISGPVESMATEAKPADAVAHEPAPAQPQASRPIAAESPPATALQGNPTMAD
jgi:hypothetical protein